MSNAVSAIAIALTAGASLGAALPDPSGGAWLLLPVAAPALCLLLARRAGLRRISVLVWVALLAAFVTAERVRGQRDAPLVPAWEGASQLIVQVEEGARPAAEEHTIVVRLRSRRTATGWEPAGGRWVIPRHTSNWLPAEGDWLQLTATASPPSLRLHELGFDPASFARSRGLSGTLWTEGPSVWLGADTGFRRGVDLLRLRMERAILSQTSGPAAGVLLAMVTSSRQELDPLVNQQFAASGITHVLAVSGMHLTLLGLCIVFVLKRLFRRVPALCLWFGAERAALLATAPVMCAYVVLTGAPASAVRSGVMAMVVVLAHALERPPSGLGALWGSVALMLAWEPIWVTDVGFQLSVAATWALLTHGRAFRAASTREREEEDEAPRPVRWLRWCWEQVVETLRTSVAATLSTAPVVLWNFGALPLFSPLANLLVVPAIGTLALPLGAFGSLLDALPMGGGFPFIWLAERATAFGLWVSDQAHPLLSLPLVWGRPSPIGCIGWGLLAVGAPGLFLRSRRADLALVAATLVLLAFDLPPAWKPAPEMRIHAIPVGQGDATFVALPTGHTLLIDAGGSGRQLPDTGTRTVLPYLRILGYRSVDVLVATHDDADHLAGIAELVPYLTPSQIWAGSLDPSKKLVRSLREGAKQVGAELLHPDQPPARLSLGSGPRQVSIETLPRPSELTGNDGSIVLRICDGTFCALLVGDTEAPREAHLLASGANLRATLLKVGHHGSKTSTTPAFLAAVAPRIAHLELGRDNKFGFPHAEVTARLNAAAVWTDRTDQGSALVVASDGESWWRERALTARGW